MIDWSPPRKIFKYFIVFLPSLHLRQNNRNNYRCSRESLKKDVLLSQDDHEMIYKNAADFIGLKCFFFRANTAMLICFALFG
jgi:hypothetical protein